MAPNKLDNQIKKKLDSREIQPSNQAWDRLDAMLSVTEEKNEKKSIFTFRNFGIAASILIALSIGWSFLNDNKVIVPQTNSVVEVEKQSQVKSEKNNEFIEVENQNSTNNNSNKIIINKVKNSNSIVNNKENALPNSNQQLNNHQKTTIDNFVTQENQLVAEVEVKNNTQQSIQTNENAIASVSDNKKIKVDAASLLNEVDGELEYSFREKVFQKINKNFKEIKQAVVTRNYQE